MEHFITVLNDDDTHTDTAGTKVIVYEASAYNSLLEGQAPGSVKAKFTYDPTNPVHLRMLADHIERNRLSSR